MFFESKTTTVLVVPKSVENSNGVILQGIVLISCLSRAWGLTTIVVLLRDAFPSCK